MDPSQRTTRCRKWYELNLAALRLRELYRSGGVARALHGLFLWRIPGLFGARIRGGMVMPAEVTLVWDHPFQVFVREQSQLLTPAEVTPVWDFDADELEEPDDLFDLGFRPLGAWELPELSGVNETLVLHDRDRTTYCELTMLIAKGMIRRGLSFNSYLAGEPERLVKTVQNWKTSLLDRPEDYPCCCVRGPVEAVYEAHREWIGSFKEELVPTSLAHFRDASARAHRTLMKHWAARGVFIEARPHLVRKLLKEKGLKQERRED